MYHSFCDAFTRICTPRPRSSGSLWANISLAFGSGNISPQTSSDLVLGGAYTVNTPGSYGIYIKYTHVSRSVYRIYASLSESIEPIRPGDDGSSHQRLKIYYSHGRTELD